MRAWVQFVYAQEPKIHVHTLQCIQFNTYTHYFVMPTIWLLFYCYHKFSSNWNVWKRKTRSNKSECFWLKHFVECWVNECTCEYTYNFYKWNLKKEKNFCKQNKTRRRWWCCVFFSLAALKLLQQLHIFNVWRDRLTALQKADNSSMEKFDYNILQLFVHLIFSKFFA